MATILANKVANLNTNTKEQFQLNQVKGNIKLTKLVEISPFQTVHVHVKSHDKRVDINTESPNLGYSSSIVTVSSYIHLKPGSGKVAVSL